MRPAIKALGIATTVIWILIVAFLVTGLLSVMSMDGGFGNPEFFLTSENVVLSLPFFIENGGYYDLSELNVTARITDHQGTLLAISQTFLPLVASGSKVESAHNISMEINDTTLTEYAEFLFNDSRFDVEAFFAVNFAYIVPVQLSTNMTVPWGAPLYNLSVGEISVLPYNITHVEATIQVGFENHSFFNIAGIMRFEVYNDEDELVTSGETSLDVRSHSTYDEQIRMYFSFGDLSRLTESGRVHLTFETPTFLAERWIPYG